MVPLLLLAFVLVPIVELMVVLAVRDVIGLGDTLGLLLVVSVVGAWLVKREGLEVWRRLQTRVEAGEMPGREVVDGFLVLLGGALMLTPGFVTDGVGLLLVLSPSRALVRAFVFARLRSRLVVRGAGGVWTHVRTRDGSVVDVTGPDTSGQGRPRGPGHLEP